MAIFPLRAFAPLENIEFSEKDLSLSSACIRLWRHGLQDLFFGENGILVYQRGFCRPSNWCLSLTVTDTLVLNGPEKVWLILEQQGPSSYTFFCEYINMLQSNLDSLMQIIRRQNQEALIVYINIGKKFLGSERLSLRSFIQLGASLLHLYKDVLGNLCELEGVKSQSLRTALMELPESSEEGLGSCNALKEMILQIRELSIAHLKKEGSELSRIRVQFFYNQLSSVGMYRKRKISQRCEDPNLAFKKVIETYGDMGLEDGLYEVEQEKKVSFLIRILRGMMSSLWMVIPLDVLQQVLQDISTNELIEVVQHIPVDRLTEILQKIPIELLRKILLEMPKDVFRGLKQSLKDFSLEEVNRLFNEHLFELKTIYQKNQSSLEEKERPVSSLLSLGISSILKAPNRSVVGQEGTSLSETYVERMVKIHPGIQEEVFGQVRVKVNLPVVDDSPHFTLVEPQSSGYLPELDLLSLASLAPGYEGGFKNTLLEKCSNH